MMEDFIKTLDEVKKHLTTDVSIKPMTRVLIKTLINTASMKFINLSEKHNLMKSVYESDIADLKKENENLKSTLEKVF